MPSPLVEATARPLHDPVTFEHAALRAELRTREARAPAQLSIERRAFDAHHKRRVHEIRHFTFPKAIRWLRSAQSFEEFPEAQSRACET